MLSDLGGRIDLTGAASLRLVDRWLGLDVGLSASKSGGIWAFPIHSVSRSQRGPELIQQSVAVLPHWTVVGDEQGRWSVDLRLAIVTTPTSRQATVRRSPGAAETAVATDLAGAAKAAQFVVDGPHKLLAPKVIGTERSRQPSGGVGQLPYT